MGTTFRVVLYAANQTAADRAFERAFARIAALDAALSDYRDSSELSRITHEAVGHPVVVSDDLFDVLNASQHIARQSDGAFDITIGSLSRLWRRARRQVELPSPGELDAARAVTGYQLVRLDSARKTVQFSRAGIRLDAGGIAKGYAADRALAELVTIGISRALVAAGGDLAIGEAPPGKAGWEVALAGLDADRPATTSPLIMKRCGISTSGDAEQWVEIGGIRYSHIIDPRTGMALQGHRSVSVVAADATSSDMLATALSVLDPGDGARVIAHYRGAAALVGIRSTDGDHWTHTRLWRRGLRPADRRSK
jgi:thiamine biosynthesis lipoprotein